MMRNELLILRKEKNNYENLEKKVLILILENQKLKKKNI